MKYVASISKAELSTNTKLPVLRLGSDRERALKPQHRNAVIDMVMAQAEAAGWKVRLVERYEEFSPSDLSAGRVTLDVETHNG